MDSKILFLLLACLSVTNAASKKPNKIAVVIPPGCEVLPPRIKGAATHPSSISLADDVQDILNEGAIQLPLKDHLKSAILILGNTCSGKTTVSLTMNSDLSTLHAKSTESGQIVIVDDGEKIGLSSTKSKTLIPNYILSPDGSVAFYDCPGFNDNRGPAQDIAAMYFIKSIVDQLEQVKFLFTIQYGSMHLGGDRNDFPRLLKHATNLLQNLQKFNESIGLIVTKVPNYDEFGWRQDANILAKFKEFLEESQAVEEQKIKDAIQSKNHELSQFHQRQLEFINILLAEDEDEMLTKVNFVRNPSKCGSFSEIPAQMELREKLTDFYNNSLSYANVNPEDFGFTLKDSTIVSLNTEIIPAIKQFILDQATSNLFSVKQTYFTQFNSSLEGNELMRIEAIKKLDKHLHQISNTFSAQPFQSLQSSKKISEIYRLMEVSAPVDNLLQMERRENWLHSLQNFTHSKHEEDALDILLFDSFQSEVNDNFQNVKQDILQTFIPGINAEILKMLKYALDSASNDYYTVLNENMKATDMTRIKAIQELQKLLIQLEDLFATTQFKSLTSERKISEIYTLIESPGPAENLTEIKKLEEWLNFYKEITNSEVNQDMLEQSLDTFKDGFSDTLQKVKQSIIQEYLPQVKTKIRRLIEETLDSAKTVYFNRLDSDLENSDSRINAIQKLQNHSLELSSLVSSHLFQSLLDSSKILEIYHFLDVSVQPDGISTLQKQEEVLRSYQDLTAKFDQDVSTHLLFKSFQNEFNAKFQSVTNTILQVYVPAVKREIEDITKEALNAASQSYFSKFNENLKGNDVIRIKEIQKLQNYLPQLNILNSNLSFQSSAASEIISQLFRLLQIPDLAQSTSQIAKQEKLLEDYRNITHSTIQQDISAHINSFIIYFNSLFQNAKQEILQVYLPDVKSRIMELVKAILDNASSAYLAKYKDEMDSSPENVYTLISTQIKWLDDLQPNDKVHTAVEKIVNHLLNNRVTAELETLTEETKILNDYENIASSNKISTTDLLLSGLIKARQNLEDKVAEIKLKLQNDVIPDKLAKLKSSIKDYVEELWRKFKAEFSEDYFYVADRVLALKRMNKAHSKLLNAKETDEFGTGNRQDVKTNLISLYRKLGFSFENAEIAEMENEMNKIREQIKLSKQTVNFELFFSSLFSKMKTFRQIMVDKVRDKWRPELLKEIYDKLQLKFLTKLDEFRSELNRETMSTYLLNITLDLGQPVNIKIDAGDDVLRLYDRVMDKAHESQATLSTAIADEEKRIKKKLKDQRDWYEFVVKLDEKVRTFEAQKILENLGSEDWLEANMLDRLHRWHVIQVPSDILVQGKPGGSADKKDLEILSDVIKYATEIKTNADCSRGEATGRFVRLSKYVNKCSFNFTILASDTIFIDCDVERRGGSINIIARNWVITKESKISLDGEDLSDDYGARADTGEDGCRGRPGLPGGNFFGVYYTITNGKMLTISAIGGRGEGGQRGGNGRDGYNGKSATKGDFPHAYHAPDDEFVKYTVREGGFWSGTTYNYWEKKGGKGTPGKKGGDGGRGGEGGHSGHITIGQVNKVYNGNINIKRWQGSYGVSGDGGKGGNGGKDGNNYRCDRSCGGFSGLCDWNSCETRYVSSHAVDGSDGDSGRSSKCGSLPIPSSRESNYWNKPVNKFFQLVQSFQNENKISIQFANNLLTHLKRKDQ